MYTSRQLSDSELVVPSLVRVKYKINLDTKAVAYPHRCIVY